MIVGRIIGWLLLVLAIAVAGHEAIISLDAGEYRVFAGGELWRKIDLASLNMAQAGIQRRLWPWLWDPIILNVLLLPTWVVLGVPGAVMAWMFRIRKDR